MRSTLALERKTTRLVLEARQRLPDQKQSFNRDLFSARDWSQLSALLQDIKTDINKPAPYIQWRLISQDQQDQLYLWACLQGENSLQHREHAAVIRQWLNTPWSASVARLVELYNQGQGQLPGIPYSRYGLNSVALDYIQGRDVSVACRADIRRYLLQREQGGDYGPCVYR